MTLKRLHREIADIKKEELGGITIGPSADNLFHWTATIPGQEGSPYEGGSFKTEIHIPPDYPYVSFRIGYTYSDIFLRFSAPKVNFITR